MNSRNNIIILLALLVGVCGLIWILGRTEPKPAHGPRAEDKGPQIAQDRPLDRPEPSNLPPGSVTAAGGAGAHAAVPPDRARWIMGKVLGTSPSEPVEDFEVGAVPAPAGEVVLASLIPKIVWTPIHNEDGIFVLENVASEVPLVVAARLAGSVSGYVQIPPIPKQGYRENVVIQLKNAGQIDGQVVDERGAPIPDASVLIGNNLAAETAGDSCVASDLQGRFLITGVTQDDRLLMIRHPEYITKLVSIEPAEGNAVSVQVTLVQGGIVEGVVLRGGQPYPNQRVAVVTFNPAEAPAESLRAPTEATTDAKGHYRISNVPIGDITVRVFADARAGQVPPGWLTRGAVMENGRATIVDFNLPLLSASVEGAVTFGGQPREGLDVAVTLKLSDDYGEDSFGAEIQPDGHFRISPIPKGTGLLEAVVKSSDGIESKKEVPVEVRDGEALHHDFDFASTSVVSGTVTGIGAGDKCAILPLKGDHGGVVIHSLSDTQIAGFHESVAGVVEVPPEGTFRIEGLEPGVYTLVAIAGSEQQVNGDASQAGDVPLRSGSKVVTLTGGEETVVQIDLQ